MNIEACTTEEQDYLIDRLVEYDLSQVKAEQQVNFIDLSKKIIGDGRINNSWNNSENVLLEYGLC